jgi:polar amino acid transport system permease protein
MTIVLTVAAMALSMLLGFVISLLRTSESRPLRFISGAYVEFFRNTPLLVKL